jgi:hypothetical protein
MSPAATHRDPADATSQHAEMLKPLQDDQNSGDDGLARLDSASTVVQSTGLPVCAQHARMLRAALSIRRHQEPREGGMIVVCGQADEVGNRHAALLVHDLENEGRACHPQDRRQRFAAGRSGRHPKWRGARGDLFDMTQRVVSAVLWRGSAITIGSGLRGSGEVQNRVVGQIAHVGKEGCGVAVHCKPKSICRLCQVAVSCLNAQNPKESNAATGSRMVY